MEIAMTWQIYPRARRIAREGIAERETLMPAKTKSASRREVIEPPKGDKPHVRGKVGAEFGKTVNIGKALSADTRSKAKTKVPKGQGKRGDTK